MIAHKQVRYLRIVGDLVFIYRDSENHTLPGWNVQKKNHGSGTRVMNTHADIEDRGEYPYVSTGRLPPAGEVVRLVNEAHERHKSNCDGRNSQVYPALAEMPRELFGVCVVRTNGEIYAVGDAKHEFSIMSVSKPFVFALVCQAIGAEQARQKLGANATGLPFNSLAAVERSSDGRTNPMVNAGAIATTSLRITFGSSQS